ncbi:MAG: ABC transporter permease [Candidatus Altiarchaeota archaeon]
MDKLLAFLRRDFLNATSYKMSFILQFGGIFFSVLTFYYISKLVGDGASQYLSSYGGDYFAFVLVGIAFWNYLIVSLQSFSRSIRDAQLTGTLESIFVTPTRISQILIGSAIWDFILTSFHIMLYLLLGVLIFDVNLNVNYIGAIVVLALTILTFVSIGIISACFTLVFKKGDPINWAITSVSGLLGGVFYPISILPDWVQKLSRILPITYALEGMRKALLQGLSPTSLMNEISILTLFCVMMMLLSLICLKYSIRKVKNEGGLVEY